MRQRYQYTVDVPVLQALVGTAHAYEVDQELVAGLRLSFPFNPMLRLWDFNKGKLTLKPCAGCKQPPGFICFVFFSLNFCGLSPSYILTLLKGIVLKAGAREEDIG